jgi:hypothetical protein
MARKKYEATVKQETSNWLLYDAVTTAKIT